jgi:glucose-6-phosphate isomerase, archaeal
MSATTGRQFDPHLDIRSDELTELGIKYGRGTFGPPEPEVRQLSAIRGSLLHPGCTGPENVYAIAMDVGRTEHAEELKRRMLLFGVVLYAAGKLGREPVRSQGHVHAVAPHCGWSTPELIEIWQGRAIVYLQRFVADDPGPCLAITAVPGQIVVVPPGWAHCVMNSNPHAEMMFGAFCDRQYAFEYTAVRARGGLSWFAQFDDQDRIEWRRNERYQPSALTARNARTYEELGLDPSLPIYEQFARDPQSMQWVSEPNLFRDLWPSFLP